MQMVSDSSDSRYERVQVYGRRGTSTGTLDLSAEFATIPNLITATGNRVTLAVNNIVSALSGDAFFDEMVKVFAGSGALDYTIGIQTLPGTTISRLGTQNNGEFTISTLTPTFDLAGGALQSEFSDGSFVKGTIVMVDEQFPEVVVPFFEIEMNKNSLNMLSQAVQSELDDNSFVSITTMSSVEDTVSRSNMQLNDLLKAKNDDGKKIDVDNALQAASAAAFGSRLASQIASTSSLSDTGELNTIAKDTLKNSTSLLLNLVGQEASADDGLPAADGQYAPLTEAQQAQASELMGNLAETADFLAQRLRTSIITEQSAAELEELNDILQSIVYASQKLKVPVSSDVMDKFTQSSRIVAGDMSTLSDTDLGSTLQNQSSLPQTSHDQPTGILNDIQDLGNGTGGFLTQRMAQQLGVSVNQINLNGVPTPTEQLATTVLGSIVTPPPFLSALSDTRTRGLSRVEAGDSTEVSYDETLGIYTFPYDGGVIQTSALSVKAVTIGLENQWVNLPNGNVTLVSDTGFAITMAPVAVDLVEFAVAVDEAGFTPQHRDNGSFGLFLSETESFSGAFAFDSQSAQALAADCGAVNFTPPAGAPNDPDHVYTLNCTDSGVTQRIVPYPAQAEFYSTLDKLGITVTTDRNNGVITAEGFGQFKPSFFVSNARSQSEADYYNTNKGPYNVSYQGLDINGDGVLDIKVMDRNTTQILYGVPQ